MGYSKEPPLSLNAPYGNVDIGVSPMSHRPVKIIILIFELKTVMYLIDELLAILEDLSLIR